MKFSEYDEKGLLALCWTGQTFWIAAQNHAAMTTTNAQPASSLQSLFFICEKRSNYSRFFLRHLRITLHTYIP